jgi:Family of unknown function (DUF5681)
MNEYKVGYRKPPKEHQFKPKHQKTAPPNGGERKEDSSDVASWLNKPLKVKRDGKSIKIHPHEAMMISLGKEALKGKPRATKQFLKYCEIAGLLEAKELEQTSGVFEIPRGVDVRIARVMIETYGLPPWDPAEYAAMQAAYERDEAHVEEVYKKFMEDLNNE